MTKSKVFRISMLLILALGAWACGDDDDDDGGSNADPCAGMADACIAIRSPGAASALEIQAEINEAMIRATEGTTIVFAAGTYALNSGIQLYTDGVTLKGQGMDATILDFSTQDDGAEGVFVSASDFTGEGFSILDPSGDGIKVIGANNVKLSGIYVEWTNGPSHENGAYGIYPVQSQNVLVEGCVGIAASDAGIYVGQSDNIIVRDNRAEFNVIGYECENCSNSEAYGNEFFNNTIGMMIHSLPDLPKKDTHTHSIHDNYVHDNNTENFANGGIQAIIPTGTGLLVMANRNIEIFNNRLENNDFNNLLLVSFDVVSLFGDFSNNDELYDPTVTDIYVHDNIFRDGGANPGGSVGLTLGAVLETPFPQIIYDGILQSGELADEDRICIGDNEYQGENAHFANLDAESPFVNLSYDAQPHDCVQPTVPTVTLPFN